MNINEIIVMLVQSILSSPESANLRAAKVSVSKNAQIASMLNSFEQRQKQAYNMPNLTQEQYQRFSMEFEADYKRLYEIPELKNYFDASSKFGSYVNNVMDQIMSQIENNI